MNTGIFDRIGPYDIDREIGRGGMAVVFLARDTRTDADVALKQVPSGPTAKAGRSSKPSNGARGCRSSSPP